MVCRTLSAQRRLFAFIGPGLPDAKMSGRILRFVYDLG